MDIIDEIEEHPRYNLGYFEEESIDDVGYGNPNAVKVSKLTIGRPNTYNITNELIFKPMAILDSTEFVNRSQHYAMLITGTSLTGEKIIVKVSGIKCYVDVGIYNNVNTTLSLIAEEYKSIPYHTIIERKQLKGYSEEKQFIRFHFDTKYERKVFIEMCNEKKFNTYSDSLGDYYTTAAIDNGLSLVKWMSIKKYSVGECDHEFVKYIYNTDISEITNIDIADISANVIQDRSILFTFDIETYSPNKLGDIPLADNDDDVIFAICITVHHLFELKPLHQIAITSKDALADDRWTTIVCKDQKELLLAFAQCWYNYLPDICAGFNSDDYDWKFIVTKAKKLGIFKEMIELMSIPSYYINKDENKLYDQVVQQSRIKLTSESQSEGIHVLIAGVIQIDVRTCFRRLFPRDESNGTSLKAYLNLCKLKSKADMPIATMWAYYKNYDNSPKSMNNMRKVLHYCVIDALRCQELLLNRDLIRQYIEIGNVSNLSLVKAIRLGDGAKVKSSVSKIAKSEHFIYTSTNINNPNIQYPGAYVFPPEKGLYPNPEFMNKLDTMDFYGQTDEQILKFFEELKTPVGGLDFASLYPSIMIAYNISPDTCILDADYEKYKHLDMHEFEPIFNGVKFKARFIKHNNDPNKYGLYPKVLLKYFKMRNDTKAKMKPHEAALEIIDKLLKIGETAYKAEINNQIKQISSITQFVGLTMEETTKQIASDISKYKKLLKTIDEYHGKPLQELRDMHQSEFSKYNTEQKAIKVLMNSFYGQAGDTKSELYMTRVACTIPFIGQIKIKEMAAFATQHGYIIRYGDTDSLYISAPHRVFADTHLKLARNEINLNQWFDALIRISNKFINEIKDLINKKLKDETGSDILKMAFEEILCPLLLLGKKKYCGIPHTGMPNFDAEVFLKGIDIVKQGMPNFVRVIGENIINAALKKDNRRRMYDIVITELTNAMTRNWIPSDFIKTAVWKPNKNNVMVKTLIARTEILKKKEDAEIARLTDLGIDAPPRKHIIPNPGERFKYVIVKQSEQYDIRGNKINLKMGDKIEFADSMHGKEIDKVAYLIKQAVGLCARFITFEPEFNNSDDAVSYKLAKSALEKYIKSKTNTELLSHFELKAVYRDVNMKMKSALSEKLGTSERVSLLSEYQQICASDEETLLKKYLHVDEQDHSDWCKLMIKKYMHGEKKEEAIMRLYNDIKPGSWTQTENEPDLATLLPKLINCANKINVELEECVYMARKKQSIRPDILLDTEDLAVLDEFNNMLKKIIKFKTEKHRMNQLLKHVKKMKDDIFKINTFNPDKKAIEHGNEIEKSITKIFL